MTRARSSSCECLAVENIVRQKCLVNVHRVFASLYRRDTPRGCLPSRPILHKIGVDAGSVK